MRFFILGTALIFLLASAGLSKSAGFTQEDRERLIRLEATLKTFMEQVDKRFEQMDKRISELRGDMNKRLERVDRELDRLVTIMTAIFSGQ